MPMNTANKLTLARVFMIPLFLVIAYWGFPGSRYVALGVYILACLTDLLDGYVARHYNQVSDFGKFADPLADKCLVMAALCWFVETGDMVGWVLAVVLLREFAVSGMRLIAVEKGRVIAAGWSGKVKTASTMVCICLMLFGIPHWLNLVCQGVILVTTVYPDVVQPATGLIDDYIRIISRLLEKGYAYVAGGNVYFDTSKLERYYVFNDHNEEDLAVGVREGVEEDVNKRNKNDFVLWFTKSKFEDQALKWDSPWGVGYPGWHIECSGISMKYNGEYLDLHCGGVDNAFPHHTNEIAQSESYLGHPWCPQWCHVAHLNTSNGKMSKSKGEFLTVSLLEEKGYAPVVYRFFCLQSHYRKSLVFSWENLDNAAVAYGKLIAKIAALPEEDGAVDMAAAAPLQQKFRTAMDNDLNTSMAVTVLYDVLKAKTNGATKRYVLADFDRVLSLDLLENAARKKAEQKQTAPASGGFQIVSESGETDAQVEALLQARYDAKKAKDFTEADRIRDDLKAMGVEITDIPGGVRWKR